MSGTKKSSREPAPVAHSLPTMITNAALPHPIIPGHSQPACEKCCRKFDTWGDLEKHRDAHRKGQVQYWCIPECGEGYTTGAALQGHQARCQEITAARYFDPTFTPPPIAASREPNHPTSAQTTGIQSGAHSTSSASDQGQGSPTKRRTVRYWPKCDRCPRDFKSRAILNEHLAGHERGTLVLCPTPGCGRGYLTTREVKVHQRTTGCGVEVPSGSTPWDIDVPERHPGYRESRSSGARHSARAGSSAGDPGADANVVMSLFTSEGSSRVLQDWQLQELERCYRKSAYPGEDEVQRLNRELWLSIEIIRRWFSARRMQVQGGR